MKKILTSVYLLSSIGLLQAQESKVNLQGELTDSKAKQVYLQRFDNKTFYIIDSAKVHKGKFSFEKAIVLPDLYGISVGIIKYSLTLQIIMQRPVLRVPKHSASFRNIRP